MKVRTRSAPRRQSLARPEPYLKFLKPGALAQLRDSRISATTRSHRSSAAPLLPPSPSSSSSPDQQQQVNNAVQGFPCFLNAAGSSRICGPSFPQRKKLVAAKTVLFLPSDSMDSHPDPIISVLNNNDSVVVAH